MKNLPLLLGTLIGTLLLIVGVATMLSSKLSSPTSAEAVDPVRLATGTERIKGPAEGVSVTIVEFADFQCPACKATQPLVQHVERQFGGKVRLIYRHFPLVNIHPLALSAAKASEAAAEQGKFWEMHDLLFNRQDDWTDLSEGEFKQKLGEYASELQLDKAIFLETMESQAVKDRITADITLGGDIKVNSTPTFYVNGQPTPAQQLLPTVESLVSSK